MPRVNLRTTATNIFKDGTIITLNSCDIPIVKEWYTKGVPYFFTIDSCTFPNFDDIAFCDTPRRSMLIPNAGGSSDKSEALSMQYMNYLFGATQFVPEMEVSYWIESKICDYLMRLGKENFGVSVTRAVSYPFTSEYTYEQAMRLMDKKLYGLIVARNSISKKHKFMRSILHIWCISQEAAHVIKKAYHDIIKKDIHNTYDNVYVICSICPHKYIYTNFL